MRIWSNWFDEMHSIHELRSIGGFHSIPLSVFLIIHLQNWVEMNFNCYFVKVKCFNIIINYVVMFINLTSMVVIVSLILRQTKSVLFLYNI